MYGPGRPGGGGLGGGSSMTAITRIGFWQTGQRSGSTCQTRRMRSRQPLEGSLSGGGGARVEPLISRFTESRIGFGAAPPTIGAGKATGRTLNVASERHHLLDGSATTIQKVLTGRTAGPPTSLPPNSRTVGPSSAPSDPPRGWVAWLKLRPDEGLVLRLVQARPRHPDCRNPPRRSPQHWHSKPFNRPPALCLLFPS